MLNSSRIVAFLLTTDYARARSFYVDTLRLEFVTQDQFALAIRANGNMIRVVRSEKFSPAQYTVLGWEVLNIESAVRDLINKGISLEKFPWGNTVQMTRGIEAALRELQPGLPGVDMNTTIFRPATFVETANCARGLPASAAPSRRSESPSP